MRVASDTERYTSVVCEKAAILLIHYPRGSLREGTTTAPKIQPLFTARSERPSCPDAPPLERAPLLPCSGSDHNPLDPLQDPRRSRDSARNPKRRDHPSFSCPELPPCNALQVKKSAPQEYRALNISHAVTCRCPRRTRSGDEGRAHF